MEMKVLLSVDMEGLQGITFGTEVLPGENRYIVGKEAMIKSTNATISGSFNGGASSVDVVDAHDGNRNLDVENIDYRASLTLGWPKELSMVHGIEKADLLFLLGYHSKAGTINGVLSHTYSVNVHRLFVNGNEVGEIYLSTMVASHFGVPVTFIAGDAASISEASEFIEDCEFVTLKNGYSRYSASSLSGKKTLEMLENGAKRAIHRKGKLLKVKTPLELEVEFNNSAMADNCTLVPSVKRIDGYSVKIEAKTVLEAYKLFRLLVSLSDFDHGKY